MKAIMIGKRIHFALISANCCRFKLILISNATLHRYKGIKTEIKQRGQRGQKVIPLGDGVIQFYMTHTTLGWVGKQ